MARSRRFWHRIWNPDKAWYRQRTLGLLAIPGLLLAFAGAVVFVYLFASVPLPEDIVASPTTVVDRTGTEVGTLSPQAARSDVALADLPEHVPQAVLAAEDRDFYSHRGISITGTLRALFTNVRAGEIQAGGSTITQQYIKNAALTPERTFTRKAKEAVLAVKLERQYDKDRILNFYLNTIYWGRGAYGIEAAAMTYFNKPARDLSVNEAATLAGIIRAPERFDPREDPGSADIRRRFVLDGMVSEGWLDQGRAQQIKQEGLSETRDRQQVAFGPAAYYLDAVRQKLENELGSDQIFRGLTVHTEMDLGAQRVAQRLVAERVADLRARLAEDPPAEDFDPNRISGALVSIEPRNGGVRVLVGGPDFARQQFNAAVVNRDGSSGRNQPGSAFKPFALAGFMDAGHSPESRFPAPPQISDVQFPGDRVYEGPVNNFGGASFGTQTVRQATLTSTNTVYVQLAAEIGAESVEEMAVQAGIPDDWLDPNPSLVLGTSDVSVLEMANGYTTFAAGGARTEPRLISHVVDADGNLVVENAPDRQGTVNSNVAYAVSDILEQNIQSGTGTAADIGRPAAGKTGTTQDSRDAWFVGYVPQLTTAVWFGHLDDDSMGDVTGGSVPAETWGAYMAEATANMEPEGFPEPDYSGLERLNQQPSPGPSRPTAAPSPTPSGPRCPSDGAPPEALPSGCVTAEPTPSPSTIPSPSTSPSGVRGTPSPTVSSPPSPPSSPASSPTSTRSRPPSPTSQAGRAEATADASEGS